MKYLFIFKSFLLLFFLFNFSIFLINYTTTNKQHNNVLPLLFIDKCYITLFILAVCSFFYYYLKGKFPRFFSPQRQGSLHHLTIPNKIIYSGFNMKHSALKNHAQLELISVMVNGIRCLRILMPFQMISHTLILL